MFESAVAVVPSEKASITSFNIASAACWVLCSPPPLSVKFGCKLTIVAKKRKRQQQKKWLNTRVSLNHPLTPVHIQQYTTYPTYCCIDQYENQFRHSDVNQTPKENHPPCPHQYVLNIFHRQLGLVL